MKKITIIVSLLFVFVISANAQNEKFFRFGLHGSPSISWLKSETKAYESNGSRIGFGYGLITEFALADNYSFSTGLESVYSGGELRNIDSLGTTINTTYRSQYLEIPVSLKMKTNEINYITYFAKFGGGINMRLNSFADIESKDNKGDVVTLNDIDIKKDINFFRIAFHIGVGIEYSLGGTTAILAGLNFNNGLTDIFKDKDIKGKNNFITLNLGVLF